MKLEKQIEFRRCLVWSLLLGTAFVAVQTYGMAGLLAGGDSAAMSGVKHAAFTFVFLHAVHVVVALLFIVFVFLRALDDHYDHEYSWGVTFCGWFWHGLGIVWWFILAVFLVAMTTLKAGSIEKSTGVSICVEACTAWVVPATPSRSPEPSWWLAVFEVARTALRTGAIGKASHSAIIAGHKQRLISEYREFRCCGERKTAECPQRR